MPLVLSEIRLYPLKSAAGLRPAEARATARGLHLDRRWMAVDAKGRFLSQRECGRLALVRPRLDSDGLVLAAEGMPDLAVPAAGQERVEAVVWKDRVLAAPVGEEADAWLGEVLGRRCRLVFLPDDTTRPVTSSAGRPGEQVSLADAFPYLLAAEASLADLNARLPSPAAMDRFRPNLVVAGGEAWAEDGWKRLRIGEVAFRVAQPCLRCGVVERDPATGRKRGGVLKALAGFRQAEGGVRFGMNLVAAGAGVLRVGDPLELG